MIPRFNNYDAVKAYTETQQLPKGGYVLKVLAAELETTSKGGYAVKISFDVAEGLFKDFFKVQYKENTSEDKKWKGVTRIYIPSDSDPEWAQRRFKTTMGAFEDSNEGFHFAWDETKLKGLLIGGVFNLKEWEYEGKTGWATHFKSFYSVDAIRNEKFKIPEDEPLKTTEETPSTINAGFMQIPDGPEDEGLPFA